MIAKMVVGICDWGIGGLGFYTFLRAERPDVDVVYIGDQGMTPYGKLSDAFLARRMAQVLTAFEALGADRVVVACNAAGTVLPGLLHWQNFDCGDMRVTGVIAPTLAYLRQQPYARIGVIGGERTIQSEVYAAPLRAEGKTVEQRVAQPLSGLIEAGKAHDAETLTLLREILEPLRNVDALVLACTHYIVLADAIADLLPNVPILDPAWIAWQEVKPYLPPSANRKGQSRFFTTGDVPMMETQAHAVFGVTAHVEPVCLPALEPYSIP